MKTMLHSRLASLAGLLLLSLLVLATGVQAAQAATGATQQRGLTPALAFHHRQGATLTAPVVTAAAGTPARGGARYPLSSITVGTRLAASGTQPAASGTSSRTPWIVGGSAVAVLLIGFAAWATMRRRRQSGEFSLAAFCALHPEDAQCTAA